MAIMPMQITSIGGVAPARRPLSPFIFPDTSSIPENSLPRLFSLIHNLCHKKIINNTRKLFNLSQTFNFKVSRLCIPRNRALDRERDAHEGLLRADEHLSVSSLW